MNFCVRCGKDCETTIDGLCTECFLDGRRIIRLPHHVDMEVCANCGEIRQRDSWVRKDIRIAAEDAAAASILAIPEARVISVGTRSVQQDPSNYAVTVDVIADISGFESSAEDITTVRVKNTVCKKCSRQLGSYYESILQLRTGGKDDMPAGLKKEVAYRVERTVGEQSRTNRQLFISKIGEVQGGVDIYLSSIALGRQISKEMGDYYGAETKESASLVGVNATGEEVYRVTYMVRIPEYHLGDAIEFEGRMYKLSSLSKTGGRATDLLTFRERTIRRSDLLSVRILVKYEDISDAPVVSVGNGEIQVLDPRNYRTVDLRVPEGTEPGETVPVADIDGVLYYMP